MAERLKSRCSEAKADGGIIKNNPVQAFSLFPSTLRVCGDTVTITLRFTCVIYLYSGGSDRNVIPIQNQTNHFVLGDFGGPLSLRYATLRTFGSLRHIQA